jgi:predicted PurR-regulated permease PerM
MSSEASGTEGGRRLSKPSLSRYVQRVLLAVGIVIAWLLLLVSIWYSARVLLMAFAGILLAVFLRGIGSWIGARIKVSAAWGVVIAALLLAGLLTATGWWLAPEIAEQFNELTEQLPKAIESASDRFRESGLMRYVPSQMIPADDAGPDAATVATRIAGFLTVTVEAITAILVILFVGIYLALTPEPYVEGAIKLFPVRMRARVGQVLDRLCCTLRYWLMGQIVAMTVVGTLVGVGLKLIGVPLALSLGVLAGLLDFIPIVGPLISAVPAVLLALLISPMHALYVVLLYVVVNTIIESNLVMPVVQRYAVALPPVLTIMALVLMGKLFGFLGLLLATPLAAAALVLIKMVYVGDVLGDRSAENNEDDHCNTCK